MSESLTLLSDTADRLFGDLTADAKLDFAAVWGRIDEVGFPALLVGEAEGGFGGDWLDAVTSATACWRRSGSPEH